MPKRERRTVSADRPLAGLAVVPVRTRSRSGHTILDRPEAHATVLTTDRGPDQAEPRDTHRAGDAAAVPPLVGSDRSGRPVRLPARLTIARRSEPSTCPGPGMQQRRHERARSRRPDATIAVLSGAAFSRACASVIDPRSSPLRRVPPTQPATTEANTTIRPASNNSTTTPSYAPEATKRSASHRRQALERAPPTLIGAASVRRCVSAAPHTDVRSTRAPTSQR